MVVINVCHVIIVPQIALSIPVPPPVVEVDPNAVKITGNDVITYDIMLLHRVMSYMDVVCYYSS